MVADSSTPGGATIERDAHTQQFVTVHNRVARDKRLKRASRGLLVEILSLPPGVRITFEVLADNGPEGRDALRTMIRELEKYGYAEHTTTRDDKGRYWTRYIFRETPSVDKTQAGSTASENPSPKSFKDEEQKDIKDGAHPSPDTAGPPVADALSRMIQGEIRDLTGATLPLDDALRIGRQLLSRRAEPPDNPIEWTRTVIRATPNPRTFLPTPTRPKFTATTPAAAPRQESIEAARAALSHLKRAPSPTGDPLRSLAAAQLGEARAVRTPGSPNDQEAA